MRCKVGDLAIIVYSPPLLAANIGAMVRVALPSDVPMHDWECIALSRIKAYTMRNAELVDVEPGKPFHTLDAWLQPIRGPRAEESETRTKEVRDDARV